MRTIPRLLAIVALLALPVLLSACGAAAPAAPATQPSANGPQLTVDQTTLDYGNVKFNTFVKAAFKVTNTGNAPLTLQVAPVVKAVEGC